MRACKDPGKIIVRREKGDGKTKCFRKEMAAFGADVSSLVPRQVVELLRKKTDLK